MHDDRKSRIVLEAEQKIRTFCELFNQDEHPVKISFIKDLNYHSSCLFIFLENRFIGTLVNNLNRVTELALEVKEGLQKALSVYNIEILTQEEFQAKKISPLKGYIFYSGIPHVLLNEELIIEEINQNFRTAFGVEIGSAKQPFSQLFITESEFRNVKNHLAEHGKLEQSRVLLKAKDHTCFTELKVQRVEYEGKLKYLVSLNDITKFAKNEKVLREKEGLFRGLVDQSISGIYILVDNKLKYTNEKFGKIFGYSRNELNDFDYRKLIYPEDWENVNSRVQKNINNPDLYKEYEFRGKKKDGTTIYLSTNVRYATYEGKPALFGSLVDKSHEVESENNFLNSELKFESLFLKAPVAMLIYQGEEVVEANPSTSEITGYSNEELIGMKFYDLVYEADRALVKDRGLRRQRGERIQNRYKFRIKRKDGEIRWVDFAGALIKYRNKPAGIIVASDITKSVKTKNEIKEINRILSAINQIHNLDFRINEIHKFYSTVTSILLQTGLFNSVYFGFFNEEQKLIRIVTEDEQIEKKYNALLQKGIVPDCIDRRLKSPEIIAYTKSELCNNCALNDIEQDSKIVVEKIEYLNGGFGTVTFALKREIDLEDESLNLIKELVEQITSIYTRESLKEELRKQNEELAETEIKLSSFFKNSNEGIYRIEFEEEIPIDLPAEQQAKAILNLGRIVECNQTFANYYGAESEYDLMGKPFKILYSKDVQVPKGLVKFIENGYQVRNYISDELSNDGRKKYYSNNNFAIIENGKIKTIWGAQRDITSNYIRDEAVKDLSLGSASKYGMDFLVYISHRITDLLGADIVLIGEYKKEANSVRTKVYLDENGLQTNIEYKLENTPCQTVLDSGLCIYESNVIEKFPEDDILNEVNAEAYIGVPLTNQNSEIIGILLALYKEPITNSGLLSDIFSLLASRVSIELERLDYEKKLKRAFSDMALILDSTLKAFVIINEDYTIRSYNEYAKKLFYLHFGKKLKKGADFSKYVIKESAHEFKKNFLQAMQRKMVSNRWKVVDITGKETWFSVDYEAALDKENKVFAIIYSFENITEQIEKESKFEEINLRNNILMSNTVDGIHVFDLQGKIIDVNDAFANLLDYDKDLLIGSNLKIYSPESMPGDPEKLFTEDNVENRFNAVYITRDGKELILEITQTPIIVNEEKLIFRSARDVTEKIAHLNKIKQLSVAVEQSPASILITDIQGRIEYVNQKLLDSSGYSYDEIIGKKPNVFKSDKTNPSLYRELWNTILNGDTWTGELQNQRKDGSLYWELISISPIFNSEGKITNFIGVKENITERKKMTEELARSKARLDQILDERTQELTRTKDNFKRIADRATEVIIQLDAYKNVIYANPVCDSFFDFRATEIVNLRFDDLPLIDENRKKLLAAFKEVEEKKQNQKIEIHTKKGFYIDMSVVPELSASNKVVGYILFGHEYTEKQKQHQQVTMSLEYERELNKARAEFYSMVSHDFRTPLTTIKASAELIEMCNIETENPQFLKAVKRINHSVDDLIEMLESLMLINKMSSGAQELNLKRVPVKRLLDEVVENVCHASSSEHDIIIQNDTEIEHINADEALLKRVFANLLSNAIKYSPERTEISISLKNDDENIIIGITDKGRGVSEEEMPQLFTMYFRSKSVKNIQGTGLGLPVVKKIVELHNGRVEVESELNVGSTFTVFLPIHLRVNNEENSGN